jgi:hypothetical protein
VSEMEEDGDSRIPGHLFVLASFFRERSPGEEGLISYRSSTLALVPFGNASHEILSDSPIMGLLDRGGCYLPAWARLHSERSCGSDLERKLTQRGRIPRVLKVEA